MKYPNFDPRRAQYLHLPVQPLCVSPHTLLHPPCSPSRAGNPLSCSSPEWNCESLGLRLVRGSSTPRKLSPNSFVHPSVPCAAEVSRSFRLPLCFCNKAGDETIFLILHASLCGKAHKGPPGTAPKLPVMAFLLLEQLLLMKFSLFFPSLSLSLILPWVPLSLSLSPKAPFVAADVHRSLTLSSARFFIVQHALSVSPGSLLTVVARRIFFDL